MTFSNALSPGTPTFFHTEVDIFELVSLRQSKKVDGAAVNKLFLVFIYYFELKWSKGLVLTDTESENGRGIILVICHTDLENRYKAQSYESQCKNGIKSKISSDLGDP